MKVTVCWFKDGQLHRWRARGSTDEELQADIDRIIREKGADPDRIFLEDREND